MNFVAAIYDGPQIFTVNLSLEFYGSVQMDKTNHVSHESSHFP